MRVLMSGLTSIMVVLMVSSGTVFGNEAIPKIVKSGKHTVNTYAPKSAFSNPNRPTFIAAKVQWCLVADSTGTVWRCYDLKRHCEQVKGEKENFSCVPQ